MTTVEEKLKAYLKKAEKPPATGWLAKAKWVVKRTLIGGAIVGAVALGVGGWLSHDYLTKREGYPIRNVVYNVNETIHYAGGDEGSESTLADHKSDARYEYGSESNTKLGRLLGEMHYDRGDQVMQLTLLDANSERVAFASEKREVVQEGVRVRGSIDFREQQAELMGPGSERGRFITYSFIAERGLRNVQVNVLEGEDGRLSLVNELVTRRWPGHGWLWGDAYRTGAEINQFAKTPRNVTLEARFVSLIREYHQTASHDAKGREALINEMADVEAKLEKVPVIATHEDGIVKWLPQESTIFLFSNPGFAYRSFHKVKAMPGSATPVLPAKEQWTTFDDSEIANPGGDPVRLRVENEWDLVPGRIWGLSGIRLGSPPNQWWPFWHRNNGGYTIEDGRGAVAKVRIKDFWIHYGDDLLYEYFLDKNGDGRIDELRELIGQVLYRISRDEDPELEGAIGAHEGKKDVSQRLIYTFMAGRDPELQSSNPQERETALKTAREVDFYLCSAVESFIIDQVNRGFGQHSELGMINQHRSNILVLEAPTVPNLGRALTPESTIVAKQDIAALLRAAGRDYVDAYLKAPTASK